MYTLYMALHINNPDVERKVREMASLTGETITEAIGRAADERIARANSGANARRTPSVEEVLELVRGFNLKSINRDLTRDEILGYGEDGYCV